MIVQRKEMFISMQYPIYAIPYHHVQKCTREGLLWMHIMKNRHAHPVLALFMDPSHHSQHYSLVSNTAYFTICFHG